MQVGQHRETWDAQEQVVSRAVSALRRLQARIFHRHRALLPPAQPSHRTRGAAPVLFGYVHANRARHARGARHQSVEFGITIVDFLIVSLRSFFCTLPYYCACSKIFAQKFTCSNIPIAHMVWLFEPDQCLLFIRFMKYRLCMGSGVYISRSFAPT